MKRIFLIAVSLLASFAILSAKVSLPSLVGDNMVLQRNSSVNVWGHAKAGAVVTVTTSWNKEKYKTSTNPDGEWSVKVQTTGAGGPYTMTVSDGEPVTINGVMLGEVWFCCGQSNMEMPLCGFMMQPVENYAEHLMNVPS